ncbi:glycosyltransferase family 4 protein [bacterium]|nr:glycosyltransferase family 4 protein [bacterium]
MHIVIDAHLALKKIDGVARYLGGLLLELPKIDPSVRYSILSLPPEKSSLPDKIFSYPNVEPIQVKLKGPSPRQHLLIPRLLRNIGADLYHHPQFDLPFGIATPSVVTIHDLKYIFHPEFFMNKNRLKSWYIKKSLKYSLQKSTRVIVVSKSTLKDIQKTIPFDHAKASVIHHGVKLKFNGQIPENWTDLNAESFVLFVGTRRPHKNIEGLIQALSLLRNEHRMNVDLVVAGKEYSDYSKPEELANQLGMESHVHFKNFVPDDKLASLYQSAQVVALVSFYEGFGFPLVEAMSVGTPVIGSNTASIPEVIGDAGLLVEPTNPADIAQKLFSILSDEKLQHRLSRAGLERARQFSWKSVAKATLNVYNQALSC